MFSHLLPHRVEPIGTLRTHPTLEAERVTSHFVDLRVTACTRRTAEGACLPAQAAAEKEEIYLRPSDEQKSRIVLVCPRGCFPNDKDKSKPQTHVEKSEQGNGP